VSAKRRIVAAGPSDRQQPWSTRGSRVERIDRVLVDELAPRVTVGGQEAHHLRDVLRVRPGSTVEAFDGRGRLARGEVVAVERESVTLALDESEPSSAEPLVAVTLAVALLKGDKLRDVVRPATELGVATFVLFVSTNCEARELSAVRLTRLRRVAQEAARQSGRGVVPPVAAPQPLDELTLAGIVLVGDPAAPISLAEHLAGRLAGSDAAGLSAAGTARTGTAKATATTGEITIVTGPEGGLTDEEVERLQARGALGVRLGPRILRADTAPVAMAAALLLGSGA